MGLGAFGEAGGRVAGRYTTADGEAEEVGGQGRGRAGDAVRDVAGQVEDEVTVDLGGVQAEFRAGFGDPAVQYVNGSAPR